MNRPHLLPGEPFPLGATWDGQGTNFFRFVLKSPSASNCACSTKPDRRRVSIWFRRRRWFKGRPTRGAGVTDIAWFRPDGEEMREQDWQKGYAKSFGVFLNGDALRELDDSGWPVRDDSFLLLFNAHDQPLTFTAPAASFGDTWRILIDTAAELNTPHLSLSAAEAIEVEGRSVIVATRPSQRT